MFPTIVRPAALLLAVVLTAGCGQSDGGGKGGRAPDTHTPLQYFKEEQAATVTPHGRIRTGTVTERSGNIEYETDNGMKWSVSYTKRADGTYRYGTPKRTDK